MERSLVHPLAAAAEPADGRIVLTGAPGRLVVPGRTARALAAAAALGAAGLAVGAVLAPARAWPMVLLVGEYLLSLGLAGLFFVAVQYASGAGWSVVIRRVPEALAALLPWGAAALAAVLLLRPSLYPWAAWAGPGEPREAFKVAWLSRPLFLLRAAAFVGAWLAFAGAIVRTSRRQDASGDPALTRRNVRLSVAFLPVFALTVWLSSYDWLMSLTPGWASTIFGVYNFAGLFASGVAAVIVVVALLERFGPHRTGPLAGLVSGEHLHDLGKLLFAFSTFWMYIWFSQYMLIWYAHIPEERAYFVPRLAGLWQPLFITNIVLNWVVPFLVLLPRGSKRATRVLVKVALAVLAGRFLDLYLMIVPACAPAAPVAGPWEFAAFLLVAALSLLVVLRALSRAAVVPLRDPRLAESLRHH